MIDLNYQENRKNSGIEYVSAKDCYEALTISQKEMVENSTITLSFAKGETIIKQGFVATHALYVEQGLVRLDVTNDHKSSTVGLLGKESFVGIICSFACKSIDFSAVALEETVINMFNLDLFRSHIKENGEFALKLIMHMSSSTNRMIHWISRLAAKNVDGSIALILQEFSLLYESSAFTLPVTRIELASLAGCSKESAINVLLRFHNDGIILLKDKDVTIIDEHRLDMIIQKG